MQHGKRLFLWAGIAFLALLVGVYSSIRGELVVVISALVTFGVGCYVAAIDGYHHQP